MASQSAAEAADEQFDLVGLTGEEQVLLTRLVAKASRGSGAMTQGAMTDAAKRRGDEMEPRPKARGVGSYAAVSAPEAPELEQTVKAGLPEGIPNLSTWGLTVMTSGKVAAERLSYEELRASTNSDHVQYCRWLMARANTMKGQFKDFISYVQAYEARHGKADEHQLPTFIPGTQDRRILKKKA